MKGYFGIKVKTEGMGRSVWLAGNYTTRLRVRASFWATRDEAQAVADSVMSDPRNSALTLKVEAFA